MYKLVVICRYSRQHHL